MPFDEWTPLHALVVLAWVHEFGRTEANQALYDAAREYLRSLVITTPALVSVQIPK